MSNMTRDDEGEFLPARPVRTLPGTYQRPQALPAATLENDDLTIVMHYLRVLWKRKGILLLCTTLGILVGLGISLWTIPLYYASTSLEVIEPQDPLVNGGSGYLDVGTTVHLLSSRELANRVKTKLYEKTLPPPKVQDSLSSLRRLLGFKDSTQSLSWQTAVAVAAGARRVSKKGDSRVLQIETQSTDPQAAAEFTNMLALEYIVQSQEKRLESYANTEQWLDRAQSGLKSKVEESERRARVFSKTNGLIATGSQDIEEDKLKQLGAELGAAMAERRQREAKYQMSLSRAESESLPEIKDSSAIAQLNMELAKLRTERDRLSTTLTPENRKVVEIQAQIDGFEAEKENERKSILQRIKTDYDTAVTRVDQLERVFKKQADTVSNLGEPLFQYKMLLDDVERNRKMLGETTTQGLQVNMASAARASSARIVDRAQPSKVPQTPNWPLNIGLGGIGGIFCGTVLLIGLSVIDARIQDRGSLETQLGLRELGVIPSASVSTLQTGQNLYKSLKAHAQGDSDKNPISVLIPKKGTGPLELVTWTHRGSVISEAVRAIMTSILFSRNGHAPQVLVITSPNKQEGKTTVTTNLAIALAEINNRVLLIDADMRLPRAHQIFDLPNTFGLSDVLHERRPIEEYHEEELVRRTHIPNLYVMLAGPARSNLARLLYSTRMKELILRFRGTFDTIIIDSAPVLAVPDARILGRSSDGIILVIRAHRTRQEAAFAAVRSFEEDGSKVLGTIFNDWNPKRSPYGDAYGGYGSYEG